VNFNDQKDTLKGTPKENLTKCEECKDFKEIPKMASFSGEESLRFEQTIIKFDNRIRPLVSEEDAVESGHLVRHVDAHPDAHLVLCDHLEECEEEETTGNGEESER